MQHTQDPQAQTCSFFYLFIERGACLEILLYQASIRKALFADHGTQKKH